MEEFSVNGIRNGMEWKRSNTAKRLFSIDATYALTVSLNSSRMQIQSIGCTLIVVKDNECVSKLQIWLRPFFKMIMNETMLDAQKSHTTSQLQTILYEDTIQLHSVALFNEKSDDMHSQSAICDFLVCVCVWVKDCIFKCKTHFSAE